jgi:hypothetical protein
MLEQVRKSGASVFIYVIFGVLIVSFVITFAPNADLGGCRGGSVVPMTVDGEKTTQSSYKIAYSANTLSGRNKVYQALELLLRRELLAQEAEKRGIRPTQEMIEEEIKKGYFFFGDQRVQPGWLDKIEGEQFFMLDQFKGFVRSLNVSMNAYYEDQTRNLQASLMADLLRDSVRVSREEALAMYLFENTTVSYDVVAFSPATYRNAMRLTDADVDRFLASHEDLVKQKWTEVEREYKATKPALKLRSIFVARSQPAGGSDAEDPAKAKLEATRAAITAGKQTFANAAKQISTDEATKANGGLIGWRQIDNPMMGDKAVNDAVKALAPGEMTPVVETERGFYLVTAEDKREGDLTYDQVKHELATDLAKDLWGKEAAKRAALDALASAQSGKSLGELFPKPDAQKIREELERQLREGQKQGAIVTESTDVPASWSDEGTLVAQADTPAAPADEAPAAAAADNAEKTDAKAAPVELTRSNDVLPAFGDIPPPQVASHGPEPRRRALSGVGDNKDAINALFDELSAGMLAPRVYEANGDYVVVQLTAKNTPSVEDFDKVADQEIEQIRRARGQVAVNKWLADRCMELAKAGRIKPMAELIAETDDNGRPLPRVYSPCMTMR